MDGTVFMKLLCQTPHPTHGKAVELSKT